MYKLEIRAEPLSPVLETVPQPQTCLDHCLAADLLAFNLVDLGIALSK